MKMLKNVLKKLGKANPDVWGYVMLGGHMMKH